jgi:hypothetical protein
LLLENDWSDLGSAVPFEFFWNCASSTNSVTLANCGGYGYGSGSGDAGFGSYSSCGTTLGCQKYSADFSGTTPVIANDVPCLEISTDVTFVPPTSPLTSYRSDHVYGMIFPSMVFTPNGKGVSLNWSIDAAGLYSESHFGSGVVPSDPTPFDVSVPNPTGENGYLAATNIPSLCCMQSGKVYFLITAGAWIGLADGRLGLIYNPAAHSRPDLVFGDWVRQFEGGLRLDDENRWHTWAYPADSDPSGSQYKIESPNFCDGADPIYFGLCFDSQAGGIAQQYAGGDSVDLRTYRLVKRNRVDRFCINLSQTDDDVHCSGDCGGDCLYQSIAMPGHPGVFVWLPSGDSCTSGCGCPVFDFPHAIPFPDSYNEFLDAYGSPRVAGQLLYVDCFD